MADLQDYLDKAREYVALAEVVDAVVQEAADQVIAGFKMLSHTEAQDISELLTGNPVADRARLETLGVSTEINATFAWGEIPAEAFRLAKLALDMATLFGAAFV